MATITDRLSTRIEILLARAVLIATALGLAYVGYAQLTTAWAIPVAIILWLGAAAAFNLGLWGRLPHDA